MLTATLLTSPPQVAAPQYVMTTSKHDFSSRRVRFWLIGGGSSPARWGLTLRRISFNNERSGFAISEHERG